MWPMPRAPISATRKRVVGVTRHTVSGTPISPLSELTGATVSATDDSTDARRSLTLVLPDEPVMPTTRSSGARSTTPRATRPKAVWTSSTTTHGTPSTGRDGQGCHGAGRDGADATKSCPSAVSPTRAT